MLNTINAHAGGCGSQQGVQQHAPERIAQSLAKAALQRVNNELAVTAVFTDLHAFDFRLFDLLDH